MPPTIKQNWRNGMNFLAVEISSSECLNAFYNVNFGAQRYASTWNHWNNPWSVENRDGLWPRLGGSGNNTAETTFWLDDLSYLRLKNVQLGYNIPKKLLRKIGINNLRIAGSAENLATA